MKSQKLNLFKKILLISKTETNKFVEYKIIFGNCREEVIKKCGRQYFFFALDNWFCINNFLGITNYLF